MCVVKHCNRRDVPLEKGFPRGALLMAVHSCKAGGFCPVPVRTRDGLLQQITQMTVSQSYVLPWQTAPVKGWQKLRRTDGAAGRIKTGQHAQQAHYTARINPLFPQIPQGSAPPFSQRIAFASLSAAAFRSVSSSEAMI